MKKKYRRAICYTVNSILLLIMSPLMAIACLGEASAWILDKTFLKFAIWLNTKLGFYDPD